MESRNVFITGAGSGIGSGIATVLARSGHRVIVTDLDAGAARNAADEIERGGGRATGMQLDIGDTARIEAVVRSAGPVEVLINNAGLQHVARLEEFPADKWHLLIAVLLTGAADMMRAVLPGMRQNGFGRIINIGSIHSLVASPFKSA